MKVLFVHPSGLMYTEVYLRLEPLGLERVAEACRKAGHEVRLLDLQVFKHKHYQSVLSTWQPDAVAFSLNYLANIPEVVDLARLTRRLLPDTLVFVGGHSASFTAREILAHADGAIDCVVKGEGEEIAARILAAWSDKEELSTLPGVVTATGEGPPPRMIASLDDTLPARDLIKKRHKYFMGVLDPCASVEFSRGCPWNCTFCSPGLSTGAATARRAPARSARIWHGCASPGCSLSTTWPSSTPSTATRSPTRSKSATSGSSTTWRPAATSCSRTRRSSRAGRSLA